VVGHIKVQLGSTIAISPQIRSQSLEPLGEVLSKDRHTTAWTGMTVEAEYGKPLSLYMNT
jgi:hypothetical protein